jgi:hypothetical protein
MKKLCLFILLLSTACAPKGQDMMVLDVEAAIGNEKAFDLSELSDNMNFIALDDSVLIGNILRMNESHNRFYILDDFRNPVRVFDKTGKFTGMRGRVGRGQNELLFIGEIAVDWDKDNLYLKGGERIVAFDGEGNQFARRDSVAGGRDIAFTYDQLVLHKYLRENTAIGEKTPIIEAFSYDLNDQSSVDICFKGAADVLVLPGGMVLYSSSGIMFDNGDEVFVKETLSDTVFVYSSTQGLAATYRLDMGRHAIPAKAYGADATVSWNDPVYFFGNIWDGQRFIISRMSRFWNDENTPSYVVFDKTGVSGGFMANNLLLDGIEFTPCYIRDNQLVGYMQAINIVDNAAAITNPDLKTLAATLREDSNPVIVVATLKK